MHRITALYYGVHAGKTLLWVAAALIAFHALANIDEIAPVDLTLVLAGGLVWHAFSDAMVGRYLTRTSSNTTHLAMVTRVAVPLCAASFAASILLARHHAGMALGCMMLSRSAYAFAVGVTTPGTALFALMKGRVLSSILVPKAATMRLTRAAFAVSLGCLAATIWFLRGAPSVIVITSSGLFSGLGNVFIWIWLAQATTRAGVFASAVMTTKIWLILSIPLAAGFLPLGGSSSEMPPEPMTAFGWHIWRPERPLCQWGSLKGTATLQS